MGGFIFKELLLGFPRIWKLYLTNIIAFVIIFFLFGYLQGSSRQLNYQNTIFSGEVSFHLKEVPRKIPSDEFNNLLLQWSAEDQEIAKSYYEYDNKNNLNKIVQDLSKEDLYKLEKLLSKTDYTRLDSGFEKRIKKDIPSILSYSRKLHSIIKYHGSISQDSGYAEVIGLEIDNEPQLVDFISLKEGRFPTEDREVLIPTSLLEQGSFAIGDKLRIEGKTAMGTTNRGAYKIVGIYNSPGLSFLFTPKIILNWGGMEGFYQPKASSVEYSLFFKQSKVPEDINIQIRKSAMDDLNQKISRIDSNSISIMDVRNIGVQFNVFMAILVYITLFVIFSLVLITNYNIYLILFRKRRPELGTLMATGVSPFKIGLLLTIESFFQLIICLGIGMSLYSVIATITTNVEVKGLFEIVLVLLTGTNKFYYILEPILILKTFVLFFIGVSIAQIPVFIQLFTNKTTELLRRL